MPPFSVRDMKKKSCVFYSSATFSTFRLFPLPLSSPFPLFLLLFSYLHFSESSRLTSWNISRHMLSTRWISEWDNHGRLKSRLTSILCVPRAWKLLMPFIYQAMMLCSTIGVKSDLSAGVASTHLGLIYESGMSRSDLQHQ